MLIDEIINFADQLYKGSATCQCCTNPNGCLKDCNNCLEQVHFPERYADGKCDYDCLNMINYYCCSFLYKYASENYHLLQKSEAANKLEKYRILSLGCGAAPDLMAFEKFVLNNGSKNIQYCGFDKNTLWQSVQNVIKNYSSPNISRISFHINDVMDFFVSNPVMKANVLVLQYIISHFYNTKQISKIGAFFNNLIDKVIMQRNVNEPFIILITDANSCYRGRDYFNIFFDTIKQKGLQAQSKSFHFLPCSYAYGIPHESSNIVFDPPLSIQLKFNPRKTCSGAQLLIEVK
jgi:hypothetical protein